MKLRCASVLALAFTALSALANADFNNATWAQGGPYTMEGLKGKVAVLYFFEEG